MQPISATADPTQVPETPPVRTSATPGVTRIRTDGRDLAPLVWRGLLLTILTLGIYRFWYRTDLRRWYWRNTMVGGDGFEYRGTPKELFIGFLIALAITLPLYFAGTLAALFIASEMTTNGITALGLLILTVLAQYGAYRARRFRMTRTVWRGLRFDQKGSPWRYAAVSLLWFMAALATLGLAVPLFRRSLEAMKVKNTRFGSAKGRFEAPAGNLMLRWLPSWLGLAVALAAAAYLLYSLLETGNPEDSYENLIAGAAAFAIHVAGILLLMLGWPFYRAAEFRIFTGGSAIGPVNFRSDLSAASLYRVYLGFGLIVLALGLATMFIGYLIFEGVIDSLPSSGGASVGIGVVFLALGYLGGVYVFMALKELILNQPFWRRAAASVTVTGLDQVGAVMATAVEADSGAGEGLADAIDFGGV
jgi:uncharacterized membrane protein YjgN (DUF898 family)